MSGWVLDDDLIFAFPGHDVNQLWLRGKLGGELDVSVGTVFLSANFTSQGDDPSIWLRAGWKVRF